MGDADDPPPVNGAVTPAERPDPAVGSASSRLARRTLRDRALGTRPTGSGLVLRPDGGGAGGEPMFVSPGQRRIIEAAGLDLVALAGAPAAERAEGLAAIGAIEDGLLNTLAPDRRGWLRAAAQDGYIAEELGPGVPEWLPARPWAVVATMANGVVARLGDDPPETWRRTGGGFLVLAPGRYVLDALLRVPWRVSILASDGPGSVSITVRGSHAGVYVPAGMIRGVEVTLEAPTGHMFTAPGAILTHPQGGIRVEACTIRSERGAAGVLTQGLGGSVEGCDIAAGEGAAIVDPEGSCVVEACHLHDGRVGVIGRRGSTEVRRTTFARVGRHLDLR